MNNGKARATMNYYLHSNGVVLGPYQKAELGDMLRHGETQPDTPACREGESEWSTVSRLLGARESEPRVREPSASADSPPAPRAFEGYGAYAATQAASQKRLTQNSRQSAGSGAGEGDMKVGALCFLGGAAATAIGYFAASAGLSNGRYLVFTGLIFYGAVRFLQGLLR